MLGANRSELDERAKGDERLANFLAVKDEHAASVLDGLSNDEIKSILNIVTERVKLRIFSGTEDIKG